MAEVASAFVSIVPTAKGFGSKLSRELSGPTSKAGTEGGKKYASGMSSGLKGAGAKIFAPLAAAAAAIGVGNFLKDAIGEARESQKVGALTAQVIKSTGSAAKVTAGQVGDLATAISNKTGIDDEAIQSASNLLLTFTNVRNEVGKGNDVFNQATQAATDLGAAMGNDPKAAAIQLGKALNDPVKGITALTRVGVSFTAEQKKQIGTLVKSGDTLSAQKIILGELKKEFGGAAAASATSGEKLSVAFANFKESIGTALLPIIDKVENALTNRVIPAVLGFGKALKAGYSGDTSKFKGILKVVAQIGSAFGLALDTVKLFIGGLQGKDEAIDLPWRDKVLETAAALRKAFDATFSFVRDTAVPALRDLGAFLIRNRKVVVPLVAVMVSMVAAYKTFIAVTRIAAAVQAALNVVMTLNPIGIVIALIAGLVVGLIIAYKKSDTFRAIVQAAFRGIAVAADFMWNKVLKPAFAALVAAFHGIQTAVTFLWSKVLKPTFLFITNAWLTVAGAIINGAASAFGWVPGLGPKLKTAAAKFNSFRDDVNKALNGVKDRDVKVVAKGFAQVATGKFKGKVIPIGLARGGSVFGPGTETSDSIPALLSRNEHVWTAAEVRGAGGHERVEALRQMAKAGRLNGYAQGGPITDFPPRFNKAIDARLIPKARAYFEKVLRDQEGSGTFVRGNGVGSRASLLAFARLISGMGYSVTEGPPPFGPVHRVHAPNSRHYLGRAIDVNHGAGTSALEQSFLRRIIPLSRTYGLDSIFMQPGHYNHAHFQYDQGGWLQPGRTMVENKTGKPEAVFNQQQLAALTAGRSGVTITGDIYDSSPRKLLRDVQREQKRHEALHPVY